MKDCLLGTVHCRFASLQAGLISYGCRRSEQISWTLFSELGFFNVLRVLARTRASKQAITLAPKDVEAPAPKPSPATPENQPESALKDGKCPKDIV